MCLKKYVFPGTMPIGSGLTNLTTVYNSLDNAEFSFLTAGQIHGVYILHHQHIHVVQHHFYVRIAYVVIVVDLRNNKVIVEIV